MCNICHTKTKVLKPANYTTCTQQQFSVCFSHCQDNNPARAQLFERAGFSGKKMEIQDDIPNLMSRYSLNRVASIRVLGGA